MSENIRVLIIEDSLFMQRLIQKALAGASDMEVIGSAKNAAEALTMIRTRKPDVATLDIILPDMDGLDLLRRLTELSVPAIVLSSISLPESAVALQAIDAGAIDCVAKPQNSARPQAADAFAAELVAKVRIAATAKPASIRAIASTHRAAAGSLRLAKTVVVIGASAGGPQTIRQIVESLPPSLAAGVLVVQHMSGPFARQFTANLASSSKIRVKEAQPGDAFVEGTVLMAGGDEAVKVEWVGEGIGAVTFSSLGSTQFGFTVWIDAAMATAAHIYGPRTIGVLLSGMGSDGVAGLSLIRRAGGCTIVQDEKTSAVFGMPAAAIAAGQADRILPIEKIAGAIVAEVEAKKSLKP